jgi:hypothetical protein
MSFLIPHQVQKLVPRVLIVFEGTQHRARYGHGILLLDPAHDHAQVLCFDDDCHSTGMNLVIDRVGYLRGQAFLHLKASCEHVHEARYLTEADNTSVRYVSNVALAKERQQMVFAQAENFNIPYDDHFVVSNIEQCLVQELIRIHPVTARQKTEGAIDTQRRILESIPARILADLLQDRPDFINHPT